MSKWSVSLQADGDRPVELDEVVALADAVAGLGGIASGMGSMSFGAQIVVEAATTAGMPAWPVARAEVIGEDEYGGFE